MLVGLTLFWVGAVLCLNGLWVLDKIGDREITVIDVFVGFVTLGVSIYLAFGPGTSADSIKTAAFILLFTFTYFWVAWNRWNGADGRGLGWFCLFVAITCVPIFLTGLATAKTLWDYLLAFVGSFVVLFLPARGARYEESDEVHRWSVHTAGHLYRVDSRLSAAHWRHARRAGAHAITVCRCP